LSGKRGKSNDAYVVRLHVKPASDEGNSIVYNVPSIRDWFAVVPELIESVTSLFQEVVRYNVLPIGANVIDDSVTH